MVQIYRVSALCWPALRRHCLQVVLLWATLTLLPLTAQAGRNCEASPPDVVKTQKGIRFASQVRDTLERSGANIALLARVGTDQSSRGVRFTHVAYLLREHPAGPWTAVHELNACGSGASDLFDEGLANFYMDDPFAYETKILIPSPAVQDKLIKALLGPQKRAMHEATYSSIAYPWSTKFQNSNGWALELYAAALADGGVRNRSDAQRWLKDQGYQPSHLHIGAGERAGARLFTPNIRFGDHPDNAWQTQTYEVSTGDSVMAFVSRYDADAQVIAQRMDARVVVAQRASALRAPAEPVQVQATPAEPATAALAGPPPGQIAPQPVVPPRPTGIVVGPPRPVVSTVPIVPVVPVVPVVPQTPAATAKAPVSGDVSTLNRAQLLQSMQGLIKTYACRPQGYLSQCRQLERSACEVQVSDAVLRCFATVSDQQLMSASEQGAMQHMQDIGYCAVEGVDASLAASPKRVQGAQGQSCASVRNYQ